MAIVDTLKNNAGLLIGLGSLIVLILAYQRQKEPVQVNVKTPNAQPTIIKSYAPQVVGPGNELEVQLNFQERRDKLQAGLSLFDRIIEYSLTKDQLSQAERMKQLDYQYQAQAQAAAYAADAAYYAQQAQQSSYREASRLM